MPKAKLIPFCLALGVSLGAQGVWYRPEKEESPVCPRIMVEDTPTLMVPNGTSMGASADLKIYTQIGRRVWPVDLRPDLGAFTAYNDKGKGVSIASLKGRVVIVALWSLNCPPSVKMLNEINGVYPNRDKFGFEILAVNFDSDMVGEYRSNLSPGGWRGITKFREANKDFFALSNLPFYITGRGKEGLGSIIGDLMSVPAILVVDKDGKLASFDIGYYPDTIKKRLGYAIKEAQGKLAPEPPMDTLSPKKNPS